MSGNTATLTEILDQLLVVLIMGYIPPHLGDVLPTTQRLAGKDLVLVPLPLFQGAGCSSTVDSTGVARLRGLGEFMTELSAAHNKKVTSCAVLHIHDISEKRLLHAAHADVQMLEGIVGEDLFHCITFGSVHWNSDTATEMHGKAREGELKDTVWKPFIDRGARVVRLDDNNKAALLDVLADLARTAKEDGDLQVIDELIGQGKSFPETTAAKTLTRIAAANTSGA